jgi:hypothetical protein
MAWLYALPLPLQLALALALAFVLATGQLSEGRRGCEPHGCGDQAPMDGFTASPANPPPPALNTYPRKPRPLAVGSWGRYGANCSRVHTP